MSGFGLLQVDFRDPAVIEEEQKKDSGNQAVADALGSHLQGLFQEWKDARRDRENVWLQCLKYFNSQYTQEDLTVISENNQSDKVFFGATRMKTVSAYARIIDLLFQPGERFGEVEPTPIPDTKDFKEAMLTAKKEIFMAMQEGLISPQAIDMQDLIMQRAEELRAEAVLDAEERAKKMNRAIEDNLKECGAERKLKMAISEMCVLGTGVIKGATIDVRGNRKWVKGADGWSIDYVEEVFPNIEFRSVFDIYPDAYATDQDSMTGLFDRHMMTKGDFERLSKLDGFDSEKITNLLLSNTNGNYTEEHHETERRSIAGVSASAGVSNRFEVLEYWGAVSGRLLVGAGLADVDAHKEYQANVWICGGQVIRAMLNPLAPKRIPYQIMPYEFNIHSFWGTGIPEMMFNSQKIMNSSVRAIEKNKAESATAFREVNTDMLQAGTDPGDLKPGTPLLRSGGDPSQPALRFYKVPDNTASYISLMAEFRKYTDEETSMPSYSHGQVQSGMTKTASGMSMLMGAATVALKATIKNIDDYGIEPLLQSFYDFNMKWNDDESIKGDSVVVARGSTALMQKEIRSQKTMQFAQIAANPAYAEFVDFREMLAEIATSLDINKTKLLYSEDEINARRQQRAESLQANGAAGMGGDGQGNGEPQAMADEAVING